MRDIHVRMRAFLDLTYRSVLFLFAAVLILQWVYVFYGGHEPSQPPTCYWIYARSFVLPHLLLAIVLLFALDALLRNTSQSPARAGFASGALALVALAHAVFAFQNRAHDLLEPGIILNPLLQILAVVQALMFLVLLRAPTSGVDRPHQ